MVFAIIQIRPKKTKRACSELHEFYNFYVFQTINYTLQIMDITIFTNSEKIIQLRNPSLNILLFKDGADLSAKIETTHFPLLILTNDFKDLNKFAVTYFQRNPLYELIIKIENSKNNTLQLINNDILAILSDPIFQSDVDLIIERYSFREVLFQNNNCYNMLFRLNSQHCILTNEIKFIRAFGNYSLIFTSKERIMERTAFSEILNRLPKDIFIQTHRSFLVNINTISEIRQHSLKIGKDTIPISIRKKGDVLDLLKKKNIII